MAKTASKKVQSNVENEQGIIHFFANFITLKFREADAASSDADDLVANQYKGKDSLTPIFAKLHTAITTLDLTSKLS
jgi:hypothetical protein